MSQQPSQEQSNPNGIPITTEDMLQIIGEQSVQIRILQKMIQTLSHSDLQQKEKQNVSRPDHTTPNSASYHNSSFEVGA